MKIRYLAHDCFAITSDTGVTIITDPYTPKENLRYGEVKEPADIVTVSHEHSDHGNVAMVRGNPTVVRGTAKVKGIEFKGIPVYHDNAGGTQRGKNTIFCFEVDGIRVCHLGDLGHQLSDKQLAELGRVDILLIPVGGHFTIDAGVATQIAAVINPRIIMPMHYKTDKLDYPVTGVDEFLRGKERERITRLEVSEVEFKQGVLPAVTQIVVLKPAL